MKTIKKMVLSMLEKNELTQPEMTRVKSGRNTCGCGCCSGLGYSSIADNGNANCLDSYMLLCTSSNGTVPGIILCQ